MYRFFLSLVASFTLVWLAALPASADSWEIDKQGSSIEISGTHAGRPFTGQLANFSAQIDYDGTDARSIRVSLIMQAESYKTGSALYDGTLPNQEWLDVKNHPTISFTSNDVSGGDKLALEGDLVFKGQTVQQSVPFTLAQDGNTATARGSFQLDRKVLNIGLASDADAAWVSAELTVTFVIKAKKNTP